MYTHESVCGLILLTPDPLINPSVPLQDRYDLDNTDYKLVKVFVQYNYHFTP